MYRNGLPETNDSYARSFTHVTTLLANAYMRTEVEAAEAALRQHLSLYPQDRLRELGHGFPRIIEALERREKEACLMGLSPEETTQRELLLKTTLVPGNITTPDAVGLVHLAQKRLQEWLRFHPSDTTAQNHLHNLEREAEIIGMLHDAPDLALVIIR